tara:strand:+ start:343 stop:564 length:222 start_codon:yes stop_codon:yes gene_type:complete
MDKFLKDLKENISKNIPENIDALRGDIKQNVQSIIDAQIKKLDLVTREEFEVQEQVLKRTREKLEKLEKKINS